MACMPRESMAENLQIWKVYPPQMQKNRTFLCLGWLGVLYVACLLDQIELNNPMISLGDAPSMRSTEEALIDPVVSRRQGAGQAVIA